MHSAVRQLTAVLPPPAEAAPAPPWERAGEAGLRFPTDYREFVDLYGGGTLSGELNVIAPTLRPFQPGYPRGFPGFARLAADDVGATFTDLRESDPDANPYPLYPSPGGLLVWATTYNADHCFWDTRDDDPDRWPVVVWLRHVGPPQWREFDGCVADFLLALVNGSYEHADLLVGPGSPPRWTRTSDWSRWYDA